MNALILCATEYLLENIYNKIMSIAILSTGGTIACTHDEQGMLVPTVTSEQLIQHLHPSFPEVIFDTVDIRQLDSSAITLSDLWDLIQSVQKVLANPDCEGIIITHGTDSLEETALALSYSFPHSSVPIILTGAQRSFDHPQADGPGNLELAVRHILSRPAPDTYIAFGSRVLAAPYAYKCHTSADAAFSRLDFAAPQPEKIEFIRPLDVHVEIIMAHAGSSSLLIDAAREAAVDGIIIAAMGSGNVGPDLAAGIERALQEGIPVVITTRVPEGEVATVYGGAGGGAVLAQKGAIYTNLRAPQARIALCIALSTGHNPADLL